MFPSTVANMVPNAAFAVFVCVFGEILYRNVKGNKCFNPLEKLPQKTTLDIHKLLEMLNVTPPAYVEANNQSEKTQHELDQASQRKKTLELCSLTMCFDVSCSCVDANKVTSMNTTTNQNTPLRRSDTSLNCKIFNKRKYGAKNELEKQNITQCKQTDDVKDDDVSFLNATMEKVSQIRDFRFQLVPLAIAFILGTVFGYVINIFTILFCRKRQSKKQIDSLEDIQLYSKFVGETSTYSEISDSNQKGQELADAGANTGEYLEPISKNTILQKASKSLADQDENHENNACITLTLDRRHADGDGYNHLKPNNGRIPTSPFHKENDSLYHTMTSAESEIAQVDGKHAENPVILEKHPVDGCCTQSSDVESKSVQGKSLENERPYSMCIHVRDITWDDDTDNEMQERNGNTNTENTYFVLEKKII